MLPLFQRLLSTQHTARKGNTNVIDDATKQEISDAMKPLEKLLGGAVPLPSETVETVETVEDTPEVVCEHTVWRRGILPGGKYVKSCWSCGAMQEIEFAEWQTISDR